ncbi:MAG: hypothetical protein L0Y56_13775 [Nitrospira sp.]|nr:hypothetical protein [Nitrospira sp.]
MKTLITLTLLILFILSSTSTSQAEWAGQPEYLIPSSKVTLRNVRPIYTLGIKSQKEPIYTLDNPEVFKTPTGCKLPTPTAGVQQNCIFWFFYMDPCVCYCEVWYFCPRAYVCTTNCGGTIFECYYP